MAKYTDIESAEETTSLVPEVVTPWKKDFNNYLKVACVALIMVVAFMAGQRSSMISLMNGASTAGYDDDDDEYDDDEHDDDWWMMLIR